MDFSPAQIPFSFVPEMNVLWFYGAWIITAIVHLAFAVGVYVDCDIGRARFHRGSFVVGKTIWALATLMGGVMVVAAYWLIHHSTLRPSAPPVPPADQ